MKRRVGICSNWKRKSDCQRGPGLGPRPPPHLQSAAVTTPHGGARAGLVQQVKKGKSRGRKGRRAREEEPPCLTLLAPRVSPGGRCQGALWGRHPLLPALPSPRDARGGVPHPTLPDMPGLAAAPSPPRDGSATTAKAPEPLPPLARGKMGSPRDPLFPPGALKGLGAEDPGILHPLCSQLVGLKRMSAGRGWEKAARANDASWDRTRGILFSCGAAGRQEAPPTAHGTQPPPARGPAGE